MTQAGAFFSRTELARLLNIPQWLLANFADDRYGYKLTPSVRGAKGRGKRGLYSLSDVYKVAVAYRMFLCSLSADEINDAINCLFPKKSDPMVVAVKDRQEGWANARCLVIDLCSLAKTTFRSDLPDGSLAVEPPEWNCQNASPKQAVVALRSRKVMAEDFQHGAIRAVVVLPFDGLLNWVDSRILGREELFAANEN